MKISQGFYKYIYLSPDQALLGLPGMSRQWWSMDSVPFRLLSEYCRFVAFTEGTI